MIICIESFSEKILSEVLGEVEKQLTHHQVNVRVVQFPSEGPFGHQIRVIDSGRITMAPLPVHMLRMVDRMDVFLNPHNGLISTKDISNELLLLTGSHYKECIKSSDPEIQKWILEINNNLPRPDLLFWLSDTNEAFTQIQPDYPPFHTLQTHDLTTPDLADKVVQHILNEARND